MIEPDELQRILPMVDFEDARFPIRGGCCSVAEELLVTMPLSGVSPVAPSDLASISFRTAR